MDNTFLNAFVFVCFLLFRRQLSRYSFAIIFKQIVIPYFQQKSEFDQAPRL